MLTELDVCHLLQFFFCRKDALNFTEICGIVQGQPDRPLAGDEITPLKVVNEPAHHSVFLGVRRFDRSEHTPVEETGILNDRRFALVDVNLKDDAGLSRAMGCWASGVSKASINVRSSVQHKCPRQLFGRSATEAGWAGE